MEIERIREVDRFVALRVRERRTAAGLSQHQLADMVGVTYQQLFKYEASISRLSAGRLFDIAQALDTPIAWFFDGFDAADPDAVQSRFRRRLLDLVRLFDQMTEAQQEMLLVFTRSLAENAEARTMRTPGSG